MEVPWLFCSSLRTKSLNYIVQLFAFWGYGFVNILAEKPLQCRWYSQGLKYPLQLDFTCYSSGLFILCMSILPCFPLSSFLSWKERQSSQVHWTERGYYGSALWLEICMLYWYVFMFMVVCWYIFIFMLLLFQTVASKESILFLFVDRSEEA